MAHIIRFNELVWNSGWYWGQWVPDSPPHLRGPRHMSIDFIPRARAEYRAWLVNMKTQIPLRGPGLSIPAPDVTATVSTCDAQIALIDDTDANEPAFQAARNEIGRAH